MACMAIQADACLKHMAKERLFCNVCMHTVYLLCHMSTMAENGNFRAESNLCPAAFEYGSVVTVQWAFQLCAHTEHL